MKAIKVHEFGEPEVMKLEEVGDPVVGPGQVVIRVEAAGVNPVDTYIRSGRYGAGYGLPYTPGMDAAGMVEEIGENVKRFRVGQRVYTAGTISGAYAEKVLCEQGQVFVLPERVTFEAGAALGVPYGTAYRALFHKACAQAGEVVLVHGTTGGVGTAAVQTAKAAGMVVIGTCGTERGMQMIAEEGANLVLNHKTENYLEGVKDFTEGRGVDIVLEMLANVNLGADLEVLAQGGRIVVIGCRGLVEIDPRLVMMREANIIGMILMHANQCEIASIHAGICAGLENGSLRPVIGMKFPITQAAQAHHQIMETIAYGKILLIP